MKKQRNKKRKKKQKTYGKPLPIATGCFVLTTIDDGEDSELVHLHTHVYYLRRDWFQYEWDSCWDCDFSRLTFLTRSRGMADLVITRLASVFGDDLASQVHVQELYH